MAQTTKTIYRVEITHETGYTNWVQGVILASPGPGFRLVTSPNEHHAVRLTLKLAKRAVELARCQASVIGITVHRTTTTTESIHPNPDITNL